jgi:hypothetical protein
MMMEIKVGLGEIFGDEVVREGIYCGNAGKLLGGGIETDFNISFQERSKETMKKQVSTSRFAKI